MLCIHGLSKSYERFLEVEMKGFDSKEENKSFPAGVMLTAGILRDHSVRKALA